MKFNWINKATTILLSSVLLGGVVPTTVPMLTTQAQADSNENAPISRFENISRRSLLVLSSNTTFLVHSINLSSEMESKSLLLKTK